MDIIQRKSFNLKGSDSRGTHPQNAGGKVIGATARPPQKEGRRNSLTASRFVRHEVGCSSRGWIQTSSGKAWHPLDKWKVKILCYHALPVFALSLVNKLFVSSLCQTHIHIHTHKYTHIHRLEPIYKQTSFGKHSVIIFMGNLMSLCWPK